MVFGLKNDRKLPVYLTHGAELNLVNMRQRMAKKEGKAKFK